LRHRNPGSPCDLGVIFCGNIQPKLCALDFSQISYIEKEAEFDAAEKGIAGGHLLDILSARHTRQVRVRVRDERI
jgi:hypothetical protein